jgi:flagellar basal body L-ring protein FlgH
VTRRVLLPASALLLLSGCAGIEAIVKKPAASAAPTTTASPSPPPAAPAPPRSGATSPSEPLRPQVSAEQEQRLLESTKQNIGDVARILGELEGRQMKPPQQEALRTAKNFLDQARSALDQRDYQRAANLATKARALTDDVAGATK